MLKGGARKRIAPQLIFGLVRPRGLAAEDFVSGGQFPVGIKLRYPVAESIGREGLTLAKASADLSVSGLYWVR